MALCMIDLVLNVQYGWFRGYQHGWIPNSSMNILRETYPLEIKGVAVGNNLHDLFTYSASSQ